MSAPVCVRCAKPAQPFRPLDFVMEGELKGKLAHDYSLWPECVLEGDLACEHPGAECGSFDPCASPAEDAGICFWCTTAMPAQEMLHAEAHFPRAAWAPGKPLDRKAGELLPFDTMRPFYVRAHHEKDLGELPDSAAGIVVEASKAGAPILLCPRCSKRLPMETWVPWRGWSREERKVRALPARQAEAFDVISKADHPVGATELGKEIHMAPGNASRLVDALVEKGLVERDGSGRAHLPSTTYTHNDNE